MHELFLIVASVGSLYYLLGKRGFDYFSLAFFSADVYFLPGFFGYVSYGVNGAWTNSVIYPETYGIMIAVLLSILLSTWCSARIKPLWGPGVTIRAMNATAGFLLLFAAAGFVGVLATAGHELLQPNKAVVLENLGRWDILFYSAASIGFPVALSLNRRALSAAFLALLLLDIFIGFRSAFAIALLSAMTLYLHRQGVGRLAKRNWRLGLLALAIGFFLFAYAYFAFAVKSGSWDLLRSLSTSPESYIFLFTHSEPFVIQQTLNEVIAYRFKTDIADLVSSIANLFTVFAPELGARAVGFNDLFQRALFPEVDYGMANNIWAQMWSAGGWPLMLAFLVIYNLVLALGNRTLAIRNVVVRAGLAPLFVYWAFYIHRNDLGYALNLEKRSFLVLAAAIAMASLAHAASGNRKKSTLRSASPPSNDVTPSHGAPDYRAPD